ncbi:serine/threonine protein kinase [Synechococcus moorigangaii CMS01]|nr:serine/threonine protein kinase [Synechococcus moorigangaii CMS01]
MSDYNSRLVIGEPLGNGCFGQVHKARDPAHGEVAAKVFTRSVLLADEEWAEFKTGHLGEAQHLSRAEHRNVVKVHYVAEGSDGDSVVICMAYCPGGSLQSHFERGPLPLRDVKRIATQVLHGLGALHQRGMLHRDIKPANILLDRHNVAQLGDFGLVTDNLVLGYGSQAGYADHIAYEVWQGEGTSAKSDIWALGMTLYRLIHGEAWYNDGLKPRHIVANGGFAQSLRWLPHVPKDWRRVIRKMLADDPASRYQSTQQVLNGVATLATDPIWQIDIDHRLIHWQQLRSGRRIRVEWERLSERRHNWRAWSEPVGAGRSKTLGGSSGVVGRRDAEAGLRRFFCP